MTALNDWDIATGVGVTALAVASGRAVESGRNDRLVDDPYAADLVRAAESPVEMPTSPTDEAPLLNRMADYVAVRTRCFDDWFAEAGARGVRQAVILASGLDTRAFREEWPEGFRLFEIDQPKVLEFKDSVLDSKNVRARCERHPLGVDLRADWAHELVRAGFDTELPTAWLAEGLFPYLPAEAENDLLDTVHSLSPPGSRLMIEHTELPEELGNSQLNEIALQWGIDMTELMSGERKTDPAERLRPAGWSTSRESFTDIAERHGRQLPADEALGAVFRNSYALSARLED
ncbi:SAM-dependent methyltransferase [Actinopolyspora halophila]|uniref:SAM-dependent methyltransferase n=1 Tax=Actinopolyspora halophila TaxID=1850 RepID=UPI000371FD10|nr:SAM-dependent methyltransferase [Actinopolyspora halophila]